MIPGVSTGGGGFSWDGGQQAAESGASGHGYFTQGNVNAGPGGGWPPAWPFGGGGPAAAQPDNIARLALLALAVGGVVWLARRA